jgi:hypothetical protein
VRTVPEIYTLVARGGRLPPARPMTRLSEYGMWTWLPAGWRVHQRVVAIVREEINAIGGQEMLMPVLQSLRLRCWPAVC